MLSKALLFFRWPFLAAYPQSLRNFELRRVKNVSGKSTVDPEINSNYRKARVVQGKMYKKQIRLFRLRKKCNCI